MVLIKVKPYHKKYIYMYIYLHTHIYMHIKTYIFILILRTNNSNNVNHKNDSSNSNERKWSYCLKKILLVVYKFYLICMDMQRVPSSLFLIWMSKGSLIVLIPLVPLIFLGLKTITIHYRDIQSALYVFQKYRFFKDYTNLFCTQIFFLGFLETKFGEF